MMVATFEQLAADSAVPHRDALLDGDGMVARLAVVLGRRARVSIDRCRVTRAKYKVGDSLRALYDARVDGRHLFVGSRTFRKERLWGVFEREAARFGATTSIPAVAIDEALGAIYWTFPHDRKIEHLSLLANREFLTMRDGRAARVRSRIVAYAPEKCATARLDGMRGETLAYAKVYANDEGLNAKRVYEALGARLPNTAAVRIPRVLGYERDLRTLVLEPMLGTPIGELPESDMNLAFERLGVGLAAFHGIRKPELESFPRLTPVSLATARRVLAAARPDLANEVSTLDRRLASSHPVASEVVCLHGDVHAKNALLQGGRVALVDLDQSGLGPAGKDIGSLLASLVYGEITGSVPPALRTHAEERFLDGYARVRPLPDAASLRWFTAAALLEERALRAVSRMRVSGLARLRAVIDAATNILDSGGAR